MPPRKAVLCTGMCCLYGTRQDPAFNRMSTRESCRSSRHYRSSLVLCSVYCARKDLVFPAFARVVHALTINGAC